MGLFFMKTKYEVRPMPVSLFTMVHSQFGVKIKAIRLDNAPEIFMTDFTKLMELSINILVFTLHILFVARALRIQSNVPLSL